jgi:hypothetical protein
MEWLPFTWEAFATLFTGMSAVGGAVTLGIRQMRISERQNEILTRQNWLGELTLRSQLFDRRMEVYEAVRAYIVQIATHAAPPDREFEQEFFKAASASRFLFSAGVDRNIDQIWRKANGFRALWTTMRHTFETEGHYGDGNPEREGEYLRWFMDRLATLPEVFGDEIRLA